MIPKKKIRIIYAAGIHSGGGLFVINYLKKKMKASEDIIYLDERLKKDHFFNKFEVVIIKNNFFSKVYSEFKIKKQINKGIKEIVFLNGLPPIFKYKSNVITYFQNANILNFTNRFDKIISSNLLRSLKFFFFKKNVNKWVVFSKSAEEQLKKFIHKGIICKEKIHIQIGKREREKKIYDFIYPANGGSHKNHKNLIEAFIILSKLKIFPKLLITLDKVDIIKFKIAYFSKKFKLKIINKPNNNRDKFLKNYNKSKALIFPSYSETLGLPLMEAQKFGIDILASNRNFAKEYTSKERLFNPNHPKDIANTIIKYIQSKK
jgi:glycosyltransferase involved in cell wall biosynthesis